MMTSALLPWTLIIVICAASDQEIPVGCVSGFIERELLIQRANKIGTAATDVSANMLGSNQFLVIPGMNFSCSGTISSFLLGVDVRNLPGNTLRVDLWRPQIESSQVTGYAWVQEAHRYITLKPGTFSPDGLIRFSLSEKVKFQEGDVLGVWQPYRIDNRVRLFYTDNLTPPLAYDIKECYTSTRTCTVNAAGHDLFQGTILLLPETDNDVCMNGFLTETELREQTLKVNINGVVRRPKQQRLFPDIQFTCNGSITKWIVGAQIRSVGITDKLPSLQIWRRTRGTNLYSQVGSSHLYTSTSNFSGIVEYMPDPPLEFQEGDVLGVYQPEADQSMSVLYYQRSTGPSSYGYIGDTPHNSISLNDDFKFTKYDYPLVNVEVTKKEINRMVPIESSLPIPTVSLDTSDNIIVITSLTAGVLIVSIAAILMVSWVVACVWRKKHSKLSSRVAVIESNQPVSEEVLFMQDNASYDRLTTASRFEIPRTEQASVQTLTYYAKAQLKQQQRLCSSTESSVEEVIYENIPQADVNMLFSTNITMLDNPAYGGDMLV